MSESAAPSDDAIQTAERQFNDGDVAAAFETLTSEVERLRGELDDAKTELDSGPNINWDGPNPADLSITATEAGNTVYPYQAIQNKVREERFEQLQNRVEQIENGDIDVVVRGNGTGDRLPIESKIEQHQNDIGGLSANEERAAIVFPQFGKAESWSGKMKLDSKQVRSILEDKTGKSAEDWNYNTIKRTMKQVAKLSSPKPEGERDARDEENLLTLEKSDSKNRLQLVAEKDEWNDFIESRRQRQE